VSMLMPIGIAFIHGSALNRKNAHDMKQMQLPFRQCRLRIIAEVVPCSDAGSQQSYTSAMSASRLRCAFCWWLPLRSNAHAAEFLENRELHFHRLVDTERVFRVLIGVCVHKSHVSDAHSPYRGEEATHR
jgi:hypothetical protein